MQNGPMYHTISENGLKNHTVSDAYRTAFNGDGIKSGIQTLLNDSAVRADLERLGSVRIPIRDSNLHMVASVVLDSRGSYYSMPYDPDARYIGRNKLTNWIDSIRMFFSRNRGLHVDPIDAEYAYTSSRHSRHHRTTEELVAESDALLMEKVLDHP